MTLATKTNRRGWNFTPEHQRMARSKVRPESNRANGAKGWAASVAKYGVSWASKQLAAYRRANPSSIMISVMDWLTEFCVSYDVEVQIGTPHGAVYADLVVPDFGLIIEVDSTTFHASHHQLHGEDRAAKDAYKDQVFAQRGWLVLRLSEVDIKSGAAKDTIDLALHSKRAMQPRGDA
jgi:very-short-patch-repair endonuclease